MSDSKNPVPADQDSPVQTPSIAVQATEGQAREEAPKKPRNRFYDEDWYDLGGGG